jgi:hypothetical protein
MEMSQQNPLYNYYKLIKRLKNNWGQTIEA